MKSTFTVIVTIIITSLFFLILFTMAYRNRHSDTACNYNSGYVPSGSDRIYWRGTCL